MKTHGDDEGYSKYSRWVTAIKSGKERTSAVQFYKDHGVSASTLAAQITSNFKDEYIKSGRTEAMKELLLDAYQAIAYVYDQEFNRYKKAYAIDKWTDD